ncbi:YebC/PmpR family DNA-binding transcriptional regulator [Mycoplasma sp. Mirounga ES2805-ORL]|uniref:YebC/PmpR family DNA-binding transcriptional regulator n=1 Tax=Mycoplasma sp. Mirounga ES2805-ORL TaxID=754514 RepID=UPI00197B129A|nr:YebC/PmpR family DNA-binding transcriptional regulator [Mycoplasma sp. Mirounga ES2805-ORL]QSF13606.1 YebC/PmpR family DNA-binding transcriptional regulator [Mycoplasma sp. Mirounga ES2805-ORL]
MSGHSHWAGIKHKKGANDAARGKVFQKLFKEIYVAATTSGGPDPETNSTLKLAISKAKSKNMPKANIDRALAKAKGEKDSSSFTELLFNATISGGATFLIKTLTDNVNRTKSSIAALFNRQNATLGKTGQVPFQFDYKGVLEINKSLIPSEDLLLEFAFTLDIENIETEDDTYLITTTPENFSDVKSAIEEKFNIQEFVQCEVTYIPNSFINYEKDKLEKLEEFIEKLEDDDDVQEVFHNIDFEEE